MPVFDDIDTEDLQEQDIPGMSGYRFSAVKPEMLEELEYTLATIVTDKTGSVWPFADKLLFAVKNSIGMLQKSPNVDFLLVRRTDFNDSIDEVHGFIPLADIDPDKYDPLDCNYTTALYGATREAISATIQYGEELVENDFKVNAIVVIITDGLNNVDGLGNPYDIKQLLDSVQEKKRKEIKTIESIQTFLIGVNTADETGRPNNDVIKALEMFKDEAGLNEYVDIGQATAQRLAKMAKFVSKSVSSQATARGTGSASVSTSSIDDDDDDLNI